MTHTELTIIDFFCGAGGFSEGFRQQGFKIVQGIDNWQPAIDTHNLNHGLNDVTKSVLDFWSEDTGDVTEIEKLDDTDVIVGSPPCVSFSSSNKSGRADKTLGIKLIEAYLRVIAVKKHKPGSKLKVWYMENVPNSQKEVEEMYTFSKLNLSEWSKLIGKSPDDIALKVKNNGDILDSGDFGAPQSRKRFVAGELCSSGLFLHPKKTHSVHITSGDILGKLPGPHMEKSKLGEQFIVDPSYKNLKIRAVELTDYFYDTGLYSIEWEEARELKINHSYMGIMSFPENFSKPCRTIMATRSAKTREAIIYPSEHNRKGNGEYRAPTIREIACLMGFPITYQFSGFEGTKWRQIGNAVSPHLSSALAKAIRESCNLPSINTIEFDYPIDKLSLIQNLNTFSKCNFDKPKVRKKNARFRRHPIKSGNITVEFQNFLENTDIPGEKWHLVMYFGTGEGFTNIVFSKEKIDKIESFLKLNIKNYSSLELKMKDWIKGIGNIETSELQSIYESDLNLKNPKNPIQIIHSIAQFIKERKEKDDLISGLNIIPKSQIPIGQLYALVFIGKLLF